MRPETRVVLIQRSRGCVVIGPRRVETTERCQRAVFHSRRVFKLALTPRMSPRYEMRPSLSVEVIGRAVAAIKAVRPDIKASEGLSIVPKIRGTFTRR